MKMEEITKLTFECTKFNTKQLNFIKTKLDKNETNLQFMAKKQEVAFTEIFNVLNKIETQILIMKKDLRVLRCDVDSYIDLNHVNYLEKINNSGKL